MAEKYEETLTKALCYGAISLELLMANECGVFSTLRNTNTPMTSCEIAKANNLKERYVREMLGCLSSAELVKVSTREDGQLVYHIDQSGKQVLDGTTLLPEMGYVKIMVNRYNDIKECVKEGSTGVVRYDDEFFNLLDDLKRKVAPQFIDCVMTNVTGLKERLESGIEVIEIGCGSAIFLVQLAAMFPKSTFTATDIDPKRAEILTEKYGDVPNMKFDVLDLRYLPDVVEKKYDWVITVDVIHDLPYPVEGLKAIRKLVKEGDGVFTFEDMAGRGSHEKNVGDLVPACFYAFGTFMCIPESFQEKDSEAHGPCWAISTVLDYARKAGFEPSNVPMGGMKQLFIGKPV